ncbi:diguanylate cyclase [Sphingomonas montana]|uniref:sensor domain-containing diguanylate cyclase n=1 Tax=Sphingomonas montana TaxID=1843236 RepID=UPI0009FB4C9A|nr:diguanylate cyclase [Sphingomonas montana]
MALPPTRPFVILGPIAVAVLYFGFAWLALHLTQGADGIATIWPPSGILLATLLLSGRRLIPYYVAGAMVASAAANLAFGAAPGDVVGMTFANMAEAVIGWWMLRGRGEARPRFTQPAEIGRFCVAATAAASASAFLASIGTGFGSAQFSASWFLTDLLGMLILTPLILIAADAVRGRNPDMVVRRRDLLLLLGLVAVVTAGVFAQSGYPLLFLPLVALLAATYRLGPIGAAGGVLTIAAIGTALTTDAHGPMMLLHDNQRAVSLFLQFYLLVMLGTALPLAALLATHRQLMRQVGESNRLLRMAERTAQMGHWRMDTVTRTLLWSPEVFRLHGMAVGDAPSLADAIAAYHPDDRERVTAFITSAMADIGGEFVFEARLVNPDGAIRHVLTRGHADCAPDGTLISLFGVIQDVTDRVTAAAALEAARATAEAAADTDQLTGLASRRRALRVLDEAIETARTGREPLSVAIFDVDHFKAVNDRFGHLIGDAVLRRIARAATGASRRDDLVGRLGGEEFVMLLPGADETVAMKIAERVRSAIEASGNGADADADAGDAPAVTISVGVARLDPDVDTSATILLNRADRALYDAKRSGRNRLRLAA